MALIDRFMPSWSLRQVDRVAVAASTKEAFATARSTDLYANRAVRLLFELRTWPERWSAAGRGGRPSAVASARIDDITRSGSGFLVLGEEPGREVVVGAIGMFWRPAIEFAAVTPASFAAFDQVGFGKLAWCLRVDPHPDGGSWISIDLRVGATDARALGRFRRYWRIVGPFSHSIRRLVLRGLVRELGAARGDEARRLAGDEILPDIRFQKTHAVTIEAPPQRIWPWLVQMGCQRAGWYSLDRLDNGGVPSAETLIPELQALDVGDVIPFRLKGTDGFAVLRLDAPRALVLGSPALLPDGGPVQQRPTPWRSTWAFSLEPVGEGACRLSVRVRASHPPGLSLALARVCLRAAHEVMERAQLHGLKRRAEARPAA